MRDVWKVVVLDALTIRPYARQGLYLLAALVVLGAVGGSSGAVILAGGLYVSFLAAYPFAVGDKNDLETLSATLPVGRSVLVAGRYAFTVVALAAVITVTSIIDTVVAVLRHAGTGPDLVLWIGISALACSLITGLQLPVYYAVGYTRGRLLAYVPLVILSMGIAALGAGLADRLGDPASVPWPPAWLLLTAAMLIFAVSGLVSWRCLEHRASAHAGSTAR